MENIDSEEMLPVRGKAHVPRVVACCAQKNIAFEENHFHSINQLWPNLS